MTAETATSTPEPASDVARVALANTLLLLVVAGLTGWILAIVVLIGSVVTDNCVDGTWALQYGAEHLISGSWQAFPPATRCTVSDGAGAIVAERVRPGTRTWIAALLLGLWPLTATGITLAVLRHTHRTSKGLGPHSR